MCFLREFSAPTELLIPVQGSWVKFSGVSCSSRTLFRNISYETTGQTYSFLRAVILEFSQDFSQLPEMKMRLRPSLGPRMGETMEHPGAMGKKRHKFIKVPLAEHFNSKEPPEMVLSFKAEKCGPV